MAAEWQYSHADALGSLRALTNAGGQVIGTMEYTPFGAVRAATGVLAPFGFTGEAQDPTSGLTYLRARFYHPALGRFLTPDSLVPDPLNGQAWNAYAYVYNDPINLVDRSGFAPEPAGGIASIVAGLHQIAGAAQQRAGALGTWWNAAPAGCDCQGQSGSNASDWTGYGNLFVQGVWAKISAPYRMISVTRLERLVGHRWEPWKHELTIPGPDLSPREIRELRSGVHRWRDNTSTVQRPGGTYGDVKVQFNRIERRPNVGFKGLGGTLAIGALIDGVTQFASDYQANRCRSPQEFFDRFAIATLLGLGTAIIGTAAFTAALAFGAPPLLAGAAGFGMSYLAGKALDRSGIRPRLLDYVTP